MTEQPALQPTAGVPDTPAEPGSIEASRALAVRRVFRGSLAALAGPALMFASFPFGIAGGLPFALGMAGFVLGGLGLFEIGRAARHFMRYGTRASQIGFLTTAGLGASIVVAGFANWIGVTVGGAIWNPVLHWAMNGVYSFGTLLVLLTLRALVLWAWDTATTRESDAHV